MISKKDLIILKQLRENARQKLSVISEKTGIPISTVHDRIRVHEKSTIKRHVSLIDFSKLGYNAKVNISFRVEKGSKERLQEFLTRHSSTNSLYKINYGYDFLGEFIFKDLSEAHNFVDAIENNYHAQTQMMNIIEELKKEEFLSNKDLAGDINERFKATSQ